MTGRGEDARARLASKRRTYADCLTTLTECLEAASKLDRYTRADAGSAKVAEATEERKRALAAAHSAVQEIMLNAPP